MMAWKLLCGKLLGLWGGFALVSIAYVLALYLTLRLGRGLWRHKLRAQLAQKPQVMNKLEQIETRGPILILLLRLNPLAHFGMLNYALSLSNIPTWQILFFSWLGATPITLFNLFIGAHLTDLSHLEMGGISPTWSISIGVGLLVLLLFWLKGIFKSPPINKAP